MSFKPGDAVRWCAQEAHTRAEPIQLDAVVMRASEKQVLIRARALDGSLLFRWVAPRTLSEAQHAKG